MDYKYRDFIQGLPNCPPRQAQSQNLEAFRFVFTEINDERNFAPAFIRKPSRRNEATDPAITCNGYGLSMFDTLDNARKQYCAYLNSYPNFHKIAGTHIAKGQISKDDGVVTDKNGEGHFTLYEFEKANLSQKFSIVVQVYLDGNAKRPQAE